jgi:hypothetical protein
MWWRFNMIKKKKWIFVVIIMAVLVVCGVIVIPKIVEKNEIKEAQEKEEARINDISKTLRDYAFTAKKIEMMKKDMKAHILR